MNVNLWEKFKEYLLRERIVDDEEDAEAYMRVFLDRGYDFENLADDLYNFAEFLWEQFSEMFGEELADGLSFNVNVDHYEFKYNTIDAVKRIYIGKYDYCIEINYLDCKWGTVAETPEGFNEVVEEFLKGTKERLVNLLTVLPKQNTVDMKASEMGA